MKYTYEKLKYKILYFINYRIRSEYEVKKKLESLFATNEELSNIIKELIDLNLINDKKFIPYFIREYFEIKKYSVIRTKMELNKKGFPSYMIQDSLEEYYQQEDFCELDQALKVLNIKYNKIVLPEKSKILSFLARKGFSYSIANQACNIFIS